VASTFVPSERLVADEDAIVVGLFCRMRQAAEMSGPWR
jgi:hypothetical protein